VFQFLDFNVVSEPRVMMPDGSLYVSKDCDVLAPAASRKSAPSKGKSRATPVHSRLLQLKPKTYMSFLMKFIHKQLFIRNTKETIVEDFTVPQVMTNIRCVIHSLTTRRQTDRQTDVLKFTHRHL